MGYTEWGGEDLGGWTDKLVYLVSVGRLSVCVCERVFSVGFSPGLDSMSPTKSRRSASHVAGTHGWLPKNLGGRASGVAG